MGTVAGCPRCSGCSGCSLLIYPPTRAQCLARAGGLWGGFLNPAKLICMRFAKNGLAGPSPRTKVQRAAAQAPGGRTSPGGLPCTPRLPTRLPCTAHHLPSRLPCTSRLPTRLPCTAQPTYPAPLTTYQPAYPAPPAYQPAYPAPPNPPTLYRSHHLPAGLPCTSLEAQLCLGYQERKRGRGI